MDRFVVELTEGELIVMKMLARGDQVPAGRVRALYSLRRKLDAPVKERRNKEAGDGRAA